ncbi:acetolactate synthase catalytic subunit [candidate division BRC1 bacterium SM23_51]|nr:MAG: acetolactate synthase catalytic subunit [candidate division BRC1 bacterium SM23_51]
MLGAQIVIDALEREGVEVVFGYPGGAILDVFDHINKSKKIRFILTRHEQGATHMADGYARVTGRPGVVMVTSGPGATNTTTGLATAYMDSVPLVVITGQVPTRVIGNDAFQEADVSGITRPVTKHNYLVSDVADLPRVFKEAFYIANSGRPGPVVIDLPKDVQQATLKDYSYPEKIDVPTYRPVYEGNPKQIKKAVAAIQRASRPLLYCGGGVIRALAHELVLALAERCEIPVTTTLLGLGGFPETHDLSLHMLGMHGTQYANFAMHECDCLIAVGTRFDDRVTGKIDEFAPNCRDNIIHIDIDPASISKNILVSVPIVGDCKLVLEKVLEAIKPCKHPEWLAQVAEWKRQCPLSYKNDGELRPQYVVEKIYEVTRGEAIITTEVGQNQMWAAHYYLYTKPRTFASSGGLGTMGYGFPAALGAQVAHPDKVVVDIAGDGSIQMNIQETATAVMNNLPVIVAILNNGYLGMVRQWQEMFYDHNYSAVDLGRQTDETGTPVDGLPDGVPSYVPDFVRLAESYGALGRRVTKKEEVVPALEWAVQVRRPVFLEFLVTREENVFPMIPAGASVRDIIGGLA